MNFFYLILSLSIAAPISRLSAEVAENLEGQARHIITIGGVKGVTNPFEVKNYGNAVHFQTFPKDGACVGGKCRIEITPRDSDAFDQARNFERFKIENHSKNIKQMELALKSTKDPVAKSFLEDEILKQMKHRQALLDDMGKADVEAAIQRATPLQE